LETTVSRKIANVRNRNLAKASEVKLKIFSVRFSEKSSA
jgi:hypothetical protein